jgi:hypothetical protein
MSPLVLSTMANNSFCSCTDIAIIEQPALPAETHHHPRDCRGLCQGVEGEGHAESLRKRFSDF